MEINYINFIKNNSDMNNDFIGHRIGLLPLNITAVKYLLLIYKIIKGHTQELNNINKEKDKNLIMKQLNTNLKLSNKTNLDLIQEFIFYINETTNDDLMEITTHNIKLKFNNSTIKISDYITQIKSFSKLLKTFEEQTDLSQHYKISHDTLNESDILNMIFTSFIPNTSPKKYGILLAKIKKFNKLNCEFKLNIGNGQKHSRFNTVSPCTYSFTIDYDLALFTLNNKLESQKLTSNDLQSKIDDSDILKFINNRYNDIINFKISESVIESKNKFLKDEDDDYGIDELSQDEFDYLNTFILDKDNLLNNFNKCDIQRCFYGKEENIIHQRQFDFYIESIGFYNSSKILKKGFKLLKKDVLDYINKIIYILNDSTVFPIQDNNYIIELSQKMINGIDITCIDSSHSIGNIISSYIYYLYNNNNPNNFVKFISYKMIHPLKKTMLLTISFKDETQEINKHTLNIFNKLKTIFENTDINNFLNN